MATCAGPCWRPASPWRGQGDRTPSCCARRRGASAWCRTPPIAISPAARICWRRCAPPPWPSWPRPWRRRSPRCGAASPATEAARANLRAVGTGYLRFALAETGLFRTAFATPEFRGFTGDPARAGESGLDPFQLLSRALDELVETGLLPLNRRPAAEFLAWSAVHGFAMLVIDGPCTPCRAPTSTPSAPASSRWWRRVSRQRRATR